MKYDITIKITLTWSKIMSFFILLVAFILDLATTKNGIVTMFALPFIVTLILGKQLVDKKKYEKNCYKPNT